MSYVRRLAINVCPNTNCVQRDKPELIVILYRIEICSYAFKSNLC